MAIYLAEDQVGADPSLIGFPTLGDCMGVVILTDTMMYGIHIMPGHNSRSTEFAKLYNGQTARRLMSCCRWDRRYDGAARVGSTQFQQWLDEMKSLAGLIKYSGPVSGINIAANMANIGADSAYCEYGYSSSGNIEIRFSLTSDTTPTIRYNLATPVRYVSSSNQTSVPYKGKVFEGVTSTNLRTSDNEKGVYEFTV